MAKVDAAVDGMPLTRLRRDVDEVVTSSTSSNRRRRAAAGNENCVEAAANSGDEILRPFGRSLGVEMWRRYGMDKVCSGLFIAPVVTQNDGEVRSFNGRSAATIKMH